MTSISEEESKATATEINAILSRDEKIQCLSRIPRRYLPNFSLASKEFDEIISLELPAFRKSHGIQEPIVLVALDEKWFSMSETVNGNHKLVEFPPMSKARTNWLSSCIGVASYVVSVGGSLELGKNAVITDCTQKPNQDLHEQKYKMVHDLCHSALGVMGSKVYAFGLCSNGTYRCQRFSLESEDCESVDVAFDENPPLTKLKGLVINEKLYIYRLGMSALVFDPLQGKIEIEKSLEAHLSEDSCVIGNKIYSLSSVDGCIHVYDGHYWRRLLKNVEVGYSSHVQLVNLRGNLLILYKSGKEVWGKEISIENEGAEVWCEMVMKMDRALFVIDHIVSVTL